MSNPIPQIIRTRTTLFFDPCLLYYTYVLKGVQTYIQQCCNLPFCVSYIIYIYILYKYVFIHPLHSIALFVVQMLYFFQPP